MTTTATTQPTPLNAATYLTRSNAVAARELAGEMMIMSATDSTLFSLNETATLIWNAADGKTSLRDIVENKICAEFDIEPETAYRDAESLVTNLAELGILQLSAEPRPQSQPRATQAQS
ncbi:MAG TPA: PqqD family protein [Candidatus Acidoferrum sp.]